MTDLPLRSIFISDFRRLGGHRVLPLDAPIVLLHGANGTGKTSVLSALELALTGEIRSMLRQDVRYTAHLPFQGQAFATVRVDVSEELAAGREPATMTVGGSRVDGGPALEFEAARFYAERCYLDQVSLGQLLELYQYREGKEESALTRFVNELLGLEQLDALRSGLADSTDFRNLKKLSDPLADAEVEARRASEDLSRALGELESARAELARAREDVAGPLGTLGLEMADSDEQGTGYQAETLLRTMAPAEDGSADLELIKSLTALGGRIEGLATRTGVVRLEEARAVLAAAALLYDSWRKEHQSAIEQWHANAVDLAMPTTRAGLDDELQNIDQTLAQQNALRANIARLEGQLSAHRQTLLEVEAKLSEAQEHAGSLAEGLAALRELSSGNLCPVCDRDFSEVSSVHLTIHIDTKISELTDQGVRLRELRAQRDNHLVAAQSDERILEQIRTQLWSPGEQDVVNGRRATLIDMRERHEHLRPAITTGQELLSQVRSAEAELRDLEDTNREATLVRAELSRLGEALGAPPPTRAEALKDALSRLTDIGVDRLAFANARHDAHSAAREGLERTLQGGQRVATQKETVTQAAERKALWDRRVKEAKRRQGVARAVLDASSMARAAIVQRVFTESLNEVWRSVFTRLAPREPYIPAFGVPTTPSRTAFELTLQTIHPSGDLGGSPQMMLSAGNLNTAALSLFIALHLAVEPVVPCLVFDDPVQAMDEVHVTQFAGLIRVLSKHHHRQVIIAVHEQELFDYLSLELSPAFEGDELITIELGAGSGEADLQVNRLTWSPDPAIAV